MQKKNFLLKTFMLVCMTVVVILLVGCSHTHKAGSDWGSTAGEHFHICTHPNCCEIMDSKEHTFGEYIDFKNPTCTESGAKYKVCSVCKFSSWITIAPLSHNFGTSSDVVFEFAKIPNSASGFDFTCTATRNCVRCDEFESETLSTADGKITAKTIIQLGCGQDEITSFTNPQFTNKAFSDAFISQNIRDVITQPKAKEHDYDYGNIQYSWADDYSYCTATVACKNADCESVLEEESIKVEQQYFEASCTEGDYTIYTATFDNGEMFAPTQTRVNGTNSATGHQYGTVSYLWANDYSSCTAHNTCVSCNVEFSETVVKTSGSDSPIVYSEKQQTCFQSGEKKYTATFENSTIFPQTVLIVERTPKLEHEWGEATFSWSVGDDGKATCTARVNCTRPLNDTTCGGSYSYTISDIAPVVNEKGETTYTADFRNITTLPENIRVKFGVQIYTVTAE
ncbi:MAG: hypothetical protein ACI4L7_03595 [Christensenellales bacterium]